jgi:hypothetical protein
MPPKVDPTEVRFSTSYLTQSTLKSSAASPDPLLPSPPNSAPSVWYARIYSERQEGWIRYREGGWKVEGHPCDGAAQVREQNR